jgi:hypothetical protein
LARPTESPWLIFAANSALAASIDVLAAARSKAGLTFWSGSDLSESLHASNKNAEIIISVADLVIFFIKIFLVKKCFVIYIFLGILIFQVIKNPLFSKWV